MNEEPAYTSSVILL